ncbi:MAG TPA: ion channel [Bacteroidia bacterium]|jgi:inward rectifier potassium channel|nr:ion channel [Bacteroidia bacterium]
MANHKRISSLLKANNDTGFSNKAFTAASRFVNKDGSFNIRKTGLGFINRFSIFQFMLTIPRWKFIGVILTFYIIINLLFTSVYLLVGTDQLQGMIGAAPWVKFKEVFYFSTQTLTTVGYGRVNPIGDGVNIVAAMESLTGLLSLAIATGLIYGRFARPRAYLIFSDHALISPYRDKTALMFRFVNYKNNHSHTDVVVKVNVGMKVQQDGEAVYQYFTLALERERVESLPMSWTVVHPIDENSPFNGFTHEDMKTADVEIFAQIRGYDDIFSDVVQQRSSYTYHEILYNRKFSKMFRESEDGMTTILELDKLSHHFEVKPTA